MKKAIIIHGQSSNPEDCWFPWLKKELESKGFTVIIPSMPDPEKPRLDVWVPFLEAHLIVDRDTYLIGHGTGCQTILRFLEKVSDRVGGVILVGGWLTTYLGDLNEKNKEVMKPWIETQINWNEVKKKSVNFVSVLSDNDPFTPLDANTDLYKAKIGAKIIVELGMGHFSSYENVKELPVVVEEILAMKGTI